MLLFYFVLVKSILALFQEDHHSNCFSLEAYLTRPVKDCVPKPKDIPFIAFH
jgi:hypothetical protein